MNKSDVEVINYEMARWLREPSDSPRIMEGGIALDMTGDHIVLLHRGWNTVMGTNQRAMEAAAWRVLELSAMGKMTGDALRDLRRAMPAFVNTEYAHCDKCSGTYHASFHEECPRCDVP